MKIFRKTNTFKGNSCPLKKNLMVSAQTGWLKVLINHGSTTMHNSPVKYYLRHKGYKSMCLTSEQKFCATYIAKYII